MGVRLVLTMALALGLGLAAGGRARADIGSDHPAAILVFPKLLVDTANGLDTLIRMSNVSDTPINVYCFYVNATPICSIPGGSCFPNQLSCQANIGGQIFIGSCIDNWQPNDFTFRLTREQPTGWAVSKGQSTNCPFLDGFCSNSPATKCQRDTQCGAGNRCVIQPCLPLDGSPLGRVGPGGQTNEGAIPLSPDDPFIGELKCIAVDENGQPVARNDLIGTALIGRSMGPQSRMQLLGYNAVGIPAIPGTGNRNRTLVLGGDASAAEYEGCPNILILDHFFDGAVDPVLQNVCVDSVCSLSRTPCDTDAECTKNTCLGATCSVTDTACATDADCQNTCNLGNNTCTLTGNRCSSDADCVAADYQVRLATDLTLIPCTEDFEERRLDLSRTVAQFLVFNEFEQRFSTSRTVDCFKEIQLSNMETSDNTRSIFSAGVAGTLTGQSRIRGVVNDDNVGRGGNTLLGIAEEFRCQGPKYQFPTCDLVDAQRTLSGTGKNLHFQGRRPQSDFIYLP
ncbi:hypothetical protein KF840_15455 [bacterium]|nr:hypothetical protein [bacterium]